MSWYLKGMLKAVSLKQGAQHLSLQPECVCCLFFRPGLRVQHSPSPPFQVDSWQLWCLRQHHMAVGEIMVKWSIEPQIFILWPLIESWPIPVLERFAYSWLCEESPLLSLAEIQKVVHSCDTECRSLFFLLILQFLSVSAFLETHGGRLS